MRKLALLLACIGATLSAGDRYYIHNLVSDRNGLADHVDVHLVNPWGSAFAPDGPFWLGNNGTGTSSRHDGTGSLTAPIVNIPSPAGTLARGKVTGVIFNGNPHAFLIRGQPAFFLFCTEDGTISGWNPAVDSLNAKMMVDNSQSGAKYKGCAVGGSPVSPMLYAADYGKGRVAVWDANLEPAASGFVNPAIPANFAPFNIQNLGGTLYVAYAPQQSTPIGSPYVSYPAGGRGNTAAEGGFVAKYNMLGALLENLSGQGVFNYPWGMAIAPASFGDFANDVLIGNFGDGMIHAFDPATGKVMGTLNKEDGSPIAIDGLWSLNFGNGRVSDQDTLYFTAGIVGQTHGLFGSIQAPPSFTAAGLENAAGANAGLAPNSFVSVFGNAMAATSRMWASSDFFNNALPTVMDGVSVNINGEAAYVNYVNPLQINFLVPPDIPPGPVQIQVTNNGLASAMIPATLREVAPAFFPFGPPNAAGNQYIAATHADNTPGGPPNYVTGVNSTPFTEGETIVLYGNGFGLTNPPTPEGQLVTTALPLATTPTVAIGGITAEVQFAGLSATGLYQFNVIVPKGLTPGATANFDVPVVIELDAGAKTQPNAVISVLNPK